MKNKGLILGLFITLMIAIASAPASAKIDRSGHMTLLAVTELSDGSFEGSTADLYLEVREGTGRVFIDTFPITKLDTQMTTRFAKEMACKYVGKDCGDLDFFYTIEAKSAIIAGPSAGAATAALTAAVLLDERIDERVVASGTINSGYLVGPVGGLKEKVAAAAQEGFEKVLVPLGEADFHENNQSINLTYLGTQLNISVVEVSDLGDLLREFTGKEFRKKHQEINGSEKYESIMRNLAINLCNRSVILRNSAENLGFVGEEHLRAENLTTESFEEFEKGKYYSSASKCFGANVIYLESMYIASNLTLLEYEVRAIKLENEIKQAKDVVFERNVTTMTDLESVIVVKERLKDAEFYAGLARIQNTTEARAEALAYANERYFTAHLWDSFYGAGGEKITLEESSLSESCQGKISEAEERYQYALLYFPLSLGDIRSEIEEAKNYFEEHDYVLCLFTATKAKSRSNIILSSVSINNDKIDILLSQKITAAKNAIGEEVARGIFPVLGYSYYEYATSLAKQDKVSAVIYAEYALELSNLDIYLKKKEIRRKFSINLDLIGYFAAGLGAGILVGIYAATRGSRTSFKKVKKRK